MQIVLQFDSSVANASPAELTAIKQAASILDALITDPITVTIDVGFDEVGGVKLPLGALGADLPTGLQSYSYAQVVSALQAHANTPLAQQIAAALPSQSQAGALIELFPAQAYALGLATPAAGAVDGYVGFRDDIPVDGQLALYLHELTHALGRVREDSLMSLYSYSAPGVLAGDQSSAAYFSIDGGKTSLATYQPADVSDWGDLTNSTYTGGATDWDLLTALGFRLSSAPAVTSQIPFQNWSTGGSFTDQISADFFHSAQPVTYSATLADGSALPSWLTFNAATETFSGTLPSGVSTVAVKLTASNSLGSASEIFDAGTPIRVSTNSVTNEHLTPGASFSLNLNNYFTGPVGSQTQFYISLAQSVGSAYNLWNQTDLPSWLHFDATTHILSGTMPTQGGLYDLEVGAWNADGNLALGGANTLLLGLTTASFNLSTISLPVAVKPAVSQTVAPGQNFTIQLPNPVFTDSSASITTITLGGQDFYASTQYSSPPPLPWTSFNAATGTISGTAPSSGSNLYHLQLTATDSNGSVGGEDIYVFVGSSISLDDLLHLTQIGVPIPVTTLQGSSGAVLMYSDLIAQHAGSTGIQSITFTDGVTPTLNLSATQLADDAATLKLVTSPYTLHVSGGTVSAANAALFGSHSLGALAVSDSAANVSANLDALATLAKSGGISSIALTDGGVPALSLTVAQAAADGAALKDISGLFSVEQTAPAGSTTIQGLSAALGNIVQFSGASANCTITPAGDGVNFTVASSGATDHLGNVQALQFSDMTLIVAQHPGVNGAVTTGNITELYAAVLDREPDVGGLAYYQASLASHPNTPLSQFAQDFLASPEYASNPAHNYAQTTAGDAQFITDSYQNLLHRTPGASEVAYYQGDIAPFIQNLTPGTSAYAGAQAQAHALVLTYFSQSPEYLSNVQVTAQTPASAQHFLVLI